MAKGKQLEEKSKGKGNKNDSGGGIARFFVKKPPAAASDTRRSIHSEGSTRAKSSKNDGAIDGFFLKKPPAAAAAASGSNSAARRKLQFDSSTARNKQKKRKSTVQLSIGQALQPPSNDVLKNGVHRQKQEVNFLHQEFPDPESHPADHRVTEIQLLRDALSIVPAMQESKQLPLNDEQRKVAECPPNIPLSVRAGAGSGKTHTMVQRAVNLVNNYDFGPEKILMITFSNKATGELKKRVASVFSSHYSPDEDIRLPTIKTFHSLAFWWICRCWKACNLGKCPSPLATKAQERSLMQRAIEENLDHLRLERCERILWRDERPGEVSWEVVLQTFRGRYVDDYNKASLKADEKANKDMPREKKQNKMTAEELQALNEEMKAMKKLYLRVECYLGLLHRKNGKNSVTCDLERRWSGDDPQCDMYLELVRKARLGHHSKNDYLREDASIWELYDKLQRETGQIDFDSMLIIFTDKVLGNEKLAHRFHSMYSHVIVDEYQDNSEAQALMLNKIVEHGSLTVVGDDDQCIYQFRGASPGNFGRLREFFLEERQITIQEETLTENHRSSANILKVAATFLQGDTSRHAKVLRPSRPPGLPVEIWKCHYTNDQAKHIVSTMIERHEEEGVAYGDMSCLFRCFQMGKLGSLTTHIQKELAGKNVPFTVVGGKTLFERVSVLDLLAYLRLSITGSPDDYSFERVINKPTRRLPKDKLIPLIKQQVKRNKTKASMISLQEAAKILCKTGFGLSSSQHDALKVFLAQIDQFSAEVNTKSLPDLLTYLWRQTGLEDFYKNQNQPKEDGKKKKASPSKQEMNGMDSRAISGEPSPGTSHFVSFGHFALF